MLVVLFIFIHLTPYSWGVEPVVTHQTSWLESRVYVVLDHQHLLDGSSKLCRDHVAQRMLCQLVQIPLSGGFHHLRASNTDANLSYICLIAGGASGVEQAVGRLVGSLCVVTGRDEDAESAMLASWVSQVHCIMTETFTVLPLSPTCTKAEVYILIA